jgi:hypothetical protein
MHRSALSRLLARLSFSKKFAIVGVVLVLPLAFVTNAYIGVQSAERAFAAKEQMGVTYITPATNLLWASSEPAPPSSRL